MVRVYIHIVYLTPFRLRIQQSATIADDSDKLLLLDIVLAYYKSIYMSPFPGRRRCHFGILPGMWQDGENMEMLPWKTDNNMSLVWQPYHRDCQLRPLLLSYFKVAPASDCFMQLVRAATPTSLAAGVSISSTCHALQGMCQLHYIIIRHVLYTASEACLESMCHSCSLL